MHHPPGTACAPYRAFPQQPGKRREERLCFLCKYPPKPYRMDGETTFFPMDLRKLCLFPVDMKLVWGYDNSVCKTLKLHI